MTNITKYCIQIFGWNLIVMILLGVSYFLYSDSGTWLLSSFAIYTIFLFIQLLVGLGLALSQNSREWGKAMLIAAGIILLIGFSICTTMMFR